MWGFQLINKHFFRCAVFLNGLLLLVGAIAFFVFVFQTKAYLKEESQKDVLRLTEKIDVILQKADLMGAFIQKDLERNKSYTSEIVSDTLKSHKEAILGFLGQAGPYLRCVSDQGDVIGTYGKLTEKVNVNNSSFVIGFSPQNNPIFMDDKGINFVTPLTSKDSKTRWVVWLTVKLDALVRGAERPFIIMKLAPVEGAKSSDLNGENVLFTSKVPSYPCEVEVFINKPVWEVFLRHKAYLFMTMTQLLWFIVMAWGYFYYKKLNVDFFEEFRFLKNKETANQLHMKHMEVQKDALIRSYSASERLTQDVMCVWLASLKKIQDQIQRLYGTSREGMRVLPVLELQGEELKNKNYLSLDGLSTGLLLSQTSAVVKLENLVGHVQDLLTYYAQSRGVTLGVTYLSASLEIQTDIIALQQALGSIMYHALFGAPKGGRVDVVLEKEEGQDQFIKFIFTDDGFDIDRQAIQKMKGQDKRPPFFFLDWRELERLIAYLEGSLAFLDIGNERRKIILLLPVALGPSVESGWIGNVYKL